MIAQPLPSIAAHGLVQHPLCRVDNVRHSDSFGMGGARVFLGNDPVDCGNLRICRPIDGKDPVDLLITGLSNLR
ncbi:hypothetical protein [Mycobacterium simiae]|uniref:hypothetical protein n=1 Tax=Mycobacterium simiae TaxID=1784 RepID=UPI00358E5793